MSRITDNNQTVGNSPEATTVCLHERPEYTLATTVYTSDYGTHSHTFQMRMGGGGQAYIWGGGNKYAKRTVGGESKSLLFCIRATWMTPKKICFNKRQVEDVFKAMGRRIKRQTKRQMIQW